MRSPAKAPAAAIAAITIAPPDRSCTALLRPVDVAHPAAPPVI
jgi:hypothetical protein